LLIDNVPEVLKMEANKGQKLLLYGSILAYCLITIEIIIMISPFALYFYSVYAPVLNFLASSRLTSWSTEFFLPHMVFLDDPVILAISYLQVLLVIGLLFFLIAAVPLYWGRFTGKGVVTFSFYAKIRHPQYLFLAVSGFGLLLYWPRFIVLIFFITMLYVYYILARNEEWRMKHEVPGMYEKYMASIPMFLPGEPGGKLFALLFGWIKPKWCGILVSYVIVLSLSILAAIGIRSYTIKQLPLVPIEGQVDLLPVFERSPGKIRELYGHVLQSDDVREFLAEHREVNLAYIMPGDFFLTALVSDYDVERFIFVAVTDKNCEPVPTERLFDLGLERMPALLVDYDRFEEEVVSVIRASGEHKWGKVPMPTF
jgi:protein-S-isoprenylcysteine O-methyltransferase Ste14